MARDPDRSKPDGLHWGDYDATGDLPNASGSSVQTGILDYGDVASVAGVLYSCTDPRERGATWTVTGGGGTVTGTGTDNQVVRWDGTSDIQGSLVSINDSGEVTLPSAGAIYASGGGVGWSIDSPDAGQMRLSAFEEGGEESIIIDHNQSVGWPVVRPGADSLWDWGSDSVRWRNGYSDTLTLTSTLALGATPQLSVTGSSFRYDPGASGGSPKVDSYLRAQSGIAVTGTNDGRPGGDLYVEAGAGSNGGGTGDTDGGKGGDLYLRAKTAGTASGEGGAQNDSGNVIIEAGSRVGLGGGGLITIGAADAYSVEIGRAAGRLGFFGGSGVTKPSITGATDADKITSIIAALASLGLATDAT